MLRTKRNIKRTFALTGMLAVMAGVLTTSAVAQAATPAATEKPKPKWEGSASIGATVTQGNSDTVLFTARIQGLRKWDKNELNLGVDGTYGEANSIKNNDSIRGYGQYNRLFSEKMYGYLLVDALHDDIADVDYRINLGPGAGYYLLKQDGMVLSVDGGPTVVFEDAGGKKQTYLTARVGEKFEYKINERARIWQKAEFLPQLDNLNNYLFNFEAGVETDITKSVKLQVYFIDNYDNEPAKGRKSNDIKLVAGVAYKF